jgi:hypothetical protein
VSIGINPDPDLVVVMSSLVASIIGGPIAWAFARRIGGRGAIQTAKSAELPAAVDQRLQRIEHAVDAIAVEMERVSEGQRFTTRLLAERAGGTPAADRTR